MRCNYEFSFFDSSLSRCQECSEIVKSLCLIAKEIREKESVEDVGKKEEKSVVSVKSKSIRGLAKELVVKGLSVDEVVSKLKEEFPDKSERILRDYTHCFLSEVRKKQRDLGFSLEACNKFLQYLGVDVEAVYQEVKSIVLSGKYSVVSQIIDEVYKKYLLLDKGYIYVLIEKVYSEVGEV